MSGVEKEDRQQLKMRRKKIVDNLLTANHTLHKDTTRIPLFASADSHISSSSSLLLLLSILIHVNFSTAYDTWHMIN